MNPDVNGDVETGRSRARSWVVPETVQASGMDCGPAALASVLRGFGKNASYGRLREACQTAVDGTSLDSLEHVAGLLGLEATETLVPIEHLLLPQAEVLPAIVVTVLPSGLYHFVVIWRVMGPLVQLMDPGRGRRWVPKTQFLREVAPVEVPVAVEDCEQWCRGDVFVDPLSARLKRLGIAGVDALVEDRTVAGYPWQRHHGILFHSLGEPP